MAIKKVFATQYVSNLDYDKAAHFGDVIFCTQQEHRPEPAPPEINSGVYHDIKKKMAEYLPGVDYILLTGSAIPNLMAGSLLQKGVAHNILKWSNRDKEYKIHKVIIK